MDTAFRYAKIGYAALAVTSLDRSLHFYKDLIGLDLVHQDAEKAFLRCSDEHHDLVLYQAEKPGLMRVGFQLESPLEMQKARAHFLANGIAIQDIQPDANNLLNQGETFRIREEITGLEMEFYSEILHLPVKFKPTVAQIARLGHVLIGVENYQLALKKFTHTLGFKISDHTPGHSAFLRCYPNPYHHSFGLAKSESNAMHHLNFMVMGIDDIGKAVNRLKSNNVEIIFGPGRHFSSGSIFLYFSDPDGLTVEYSFEMEEFPETNYRQARILNRSPETADQWGGKPSRSLKPFGKIY